MTSVFIGILLLISCSHSKQGNHYHWDFIQKDFSTKDITMLSMYDVFSFKRLSDSVIVMNGEIFQGWKVPSIQVKDTLHLQSNNILHDSEGNQTRQILSYSKSNKVLFELTISHSSYNQVAYISSKSTDNSIQETTQTVHQLDYTGKLSIKDGKVTYCSDNLYVK